MLFCEKKKRHIEGFPEIFPDPPLRDNAGDFDF